MTVVVRSSSGDAATDECGARCRARRGIATIPVYDVSTMEEQGESALDPGAAVRCGSMIGVFALMALVLATVGVYGLIAYSVAERQHEIGILTRAGCAGGDVRRLVVGQGVRLTLMGVLIGLVGALILGRAGHALNAVWHDTHTIAPTLVAVSAILLTRWRCSRAGFRHAGPRVPTSLKLCAGNSQEIEPQSNAEDAETKLVSASAGFKILWTPAQKPVAHPGACPRTSPSRHRS